MIPSPEKFKNIGGPSSFAAGLLLGGLCLHWLLLPRPPIPAAERFSSSDYAGTGEMLLHGVREPRIDVSHRMPLATISAALLAHHSGMTSDALRTRLRAALLSMAALAGGILQPGLLAPLAAAAAGGALIDATFLSTFPELLFTFVLLLTAGLLAWRAQAPSTGRTWLLALALGTSLLCRSVLVFFPPLLALLEGFLLHREAPRRYRKQAAILCIVPYLFLLPWVNMNRVLHHQFIPFEHGAANFNLVTGVLGLVQASGGSPLALVDTTQDVIRGGYALRWAAWEIVRHPLRYLEGCARRLAFVVSMQPYLYLFALLSLWVYRRRRDYLQVGLLALYFTFIYCTMSVMERYMRPLWPVLAVLGASLVALPWARAAAREPSLPRRLCARILTAALGFVFAASLHAAWRVHAYARKAGGAPSQSDAEDYADAVRRYPEDSWLRLDGGKHKLREGRADLALEDFARAARLQPENPEPALLGAWAEALVGRPAALLKWPLIEEPRDPAGLYLNIHARVYKAYALLGLGRTAEASEQLSRAWEAVRAMSSNGRLPGQAATEEDLLVLRRLREYDRHFTTIVFVLLDHVPPRRKLGLVDELAKLAPGSTAILVEQASLALAVGRRDIARAVLARIEKLEPDANDRLRLAEIHSLLDEPRRAEGMLGPLAERRPDLQIDLAAINARARESEKALSLLAKAAKANYDAEKTRRIAGVYLKLDQPGRAVDLLKTLTRRSPNQAAFWLDLAEAASKAEELPLAARSLARARELPLGPAERHRLALVHQGRGEFKAALELLDRLLRERPGTAKYLNDRGVCRYLDGDADAAIEDLRRALKADPDMISAYASLGTIYTARKQLPEAAKVYDLAIARNPSRSDPQMETIRRDRESVRSGAGGRR